MGIEQRTAAISRIDGRIGLDHAFQRPVVVLGLDAAVERTHHARGQRAAE